MLHQKITADALASLRRTVWSDGLVSSAEAEQLFDLNDAADPADRDWTDFFVEALLDYLLSRGEPKGFVTDADAAWLIGHFDRDGRLDSATELEALVHLFEKAEQLPDALRRYGLSQIEQAVLTGEGPTRRGDALDPGSINQTECDLMRRMIFSTGGDTPARVGREEAEILFRLKDATLGAANASGWKTLFVQGVANHLLTDRHAPQPDRATAVRLDKFMDDHAVHVGGFLKRPDWSLGAPEAPLPADPDDGGYSPGEQAWLDGEIAHDKVDPLEQALLDFISGETGTR
jgi:hypothetical protein